YLDDIENFLNINVRKLRVEGLRFAEEFLCCTEAPRLHWDITFECMRLARDQGCRVVLNGHYGDQMMHSDAHLVQLARRFRYFQFRREYAALAASMTDVNAPYWRRYFVEALFRDLTPQLIKPMARRMDGILRSDQRPCWYSTSFRRRALLRRV